MITKERIDTHNLFEIDRLIYEGNHTIAEIGEQLNLIFFTTDADGQMTYSNTACQQWLSLENGRSGEIHLEQYLDTDQQFTTESKSDNAVMIHLTKVWFPNYLDYRLCLLSHIAMSNGDAIMYSMVPLMEWEHLNSRLSELVKEEDFIKEHRQYYNLLTKREKEVVRYIADGYSTLEISDELSISKHTVEQHRKNIKKKLKAGTIATIVKYGRVFRC
ncbi:MAG: LuxR C-terminal-related transcriptional regulator [Bacteroidota bacterium]